MLSDTSAVPVLQFGTAQGCHLGCAPLFLLYPLLLSRRPAQQAFVQSVRRPELKTGDADSPHDF
eukprot:SAG31_NODE_2454_length_5664_cov_4.255885_5_plen_64_part_00